ncbi:sensor histidine kinase [Arenibacter sp. GZD96]|uniref:sensor histidine kinase n=1 Tax=Aurantibrevibacter litoralis TaxID=3106030 RepID=UPI002AFF6C75|nr:sensor histidine kinase [Arenibacter sp. GZD-96]MEA1785967.1 sensor histidine kinase [Arenibacter sp. GZD-96]
MINLFLFIGLMQSGSNLKITNECWQALMNLEIKKAQKISTKIEDIQLRDLTLKYIDVITTGRPVQIDAIQVKNLNNEQKILYHLVKAQNEVIIGNGSSLQAYKDLSSALFISNENGFKELSKLSLVTILNLLKSEIFIGGNQHLTYLTYFKELSDSKNDKIISSYFDVVFASKENESLVHSEDLGDLIKNLDSIFATVPDTHPYKPFYLYEKGIESKLTGAYDNAIDYLRKAIKFCKEPQYSRLESILHWQLSHTHMLNNNLAKAEEELVLSQNTSINLKEQFYDDRLKAWILKEKEMYDSAYYYLNSSLLKEFELGAKTNSLESGILAVKNETDKLKIDKLQLENKKSKVQLYLFLVLFALVITVITATFAYKNSLKRRLLAEQQELIQKQRVETLLRDQELIGIDAMIAGQEKERQKVANELHDDLGSLLTTMKHHFENSQIGKNNPRLIPVEKLLNEAYHKVRGIAHSKNSGVMSNQGLLPAIKKMSSVISETNAIKVVVEDFGMGTRLENAIALNIFRMIQELVANTIKHSKATKVTIQLTQHADNFNIIIEDNGIGFDYGALDKKTSGMGLNNIEKRVEHMAGRFTIDSVMGKGTSIIIDIPI